VSGSSPRRAENHYSYTVYADAATARTFDDRRFGGPIGELVARSQADVLTNFAGDVRGRRLLDVGTGTGRAAFLFAARGADVTGIDASEQMLEVASRRGVEQGLAVSFRKGDAQHLDCADRAFDVVVSLRVLMHTPDWRMALAEFCRVSDRLVIVDYPSARGAALVQALGRRLLYAIGVRTEPYRVFTDRQIAKVLGNHSFRVRAVHRQFVLPIALHKAIGSKRLTTGIERVLARAGLLRLVGSPVTLLAERCASS
jgi:SAM-dependent methyltransferase